MLADSKYLFSYAFLGTVTCVAVTAWCRLATSNLVLNSKIKMKAYI